MNTYLTILLLTLSTANAEESLDSKKTSSVYMLSTERDFVGLGQAYMYLKENSDQFKISNFLS